MNWKRTIGVEEPLLILRDIYPLHLALLLLKDIQSPTPPWLSLFQDDLVQPLEFPQ